MGLRGNGIVLRPWREADAPAVAEACRDPDSPRWIPFVPSPYTDDDARQYVRECIEAGDGRHPFAIADPARGSLLGSIDMSANRMQTGHVGSWIAAEARSGGVSQ